MVELIQSLYNRGDQELADALLPELEKIQAGELNRHGRAGPRGGGQADHVMDEASTVHGPIEPEPLAPADAIPRAQLLPSQLQIARPAHSNPEWLDGTTSLEESERAKALLKAGKGTMIMTCGDTIHNGRRFRCAACRWPQL